MRVEVKIYIGLILGAGMWAVARAAAGWHSDDLTRFLCWLAVCVLVSGFKLKRPGNEAAVSANFLFVLLGVSRMTLGETMALGMAGTVVQCFWRAQDSVNPLRLLINCASMAIAVTGCYAFCGSMGTQCGASLLLGAALVFFFMNTAPAAGVVALTGKRGLAQTWRDSWVWSFPFYVLGASIAWLLVLLTHDFRWTGSLLMIPMLFLIYRSYRMYLLRLKDEKRHAREVAGLHLRTVEALALAMEAKDQATHEHLCRVRTYVEEIGRDMGLSEGDLEGLRAAALLHDIGKLAVPEHVLSKPGKMTAEEFEKMKIHPIVGAEILECAGFPAPVAPIVEAHHERWDGSGYPFGLKGEEIPLGARILAAVDALDALATDRQYRRALPLDEAMAQIESLSGKSFDPAVVDVLKRRYRELESIAQSQPLERSKLRGVKANPGSAPAAGLEAAQPLEKQQPGRSFLDSIGAAREEGRLLFELTRELGTSLSVDETLSMVGARLKRLIPFDAIVVYIVRGGVLTPEYVSGEDFRLFSSLRIPLGQGVSGWVAKQEKPIVNGNPSAECAHLNDPQVASTLRSALSAPLEGVNGTVGVLTLYRSDKDAFSRDNLRVLQAITPKVSLSIENALRFRQAEDSATTDYLTNLPNARALFPRLESEIARCRRESTCLTVVVCDLNGFKQINDVYGHLEGNRLLRQVADSLRANCRPYDYVARMGGDEFVLLLLGQEEAASEHRLEELRRMEWVVAQDEGIMDRVTLSLGAAAFPRDGSDADKLLGEADRRMYKAKQSYKLPPAAMPALSAHSAVVTAAIR